MLIFYFEKGFSSFYFSLANTEKLLKDDYDRDLDKFKRATDYVCSRSYAEVGEQTKFKLLLL